MVFAESWADIAIAVGALGAAFAAIRGVNTWKKSLEDVRMHDAARELLIATYKMRDAIEIYRDPFIPVYEQNPEDVRNGVTTGDRSNDGASAMAYVYNNRNKLLREVYVQFSEAELVAEVLWSDDIKNRTQRFLSAINEVRRATNELIMRLPQAPQTQQQRQEERDLRSKISGRLADPNDQMSVEILQAIEEIEKPMRNAL